MNEETLLGGDVAQREPWAAGDSPTRPRSLSELRARIRTLFGRVDQEAIEYSNAHGVENAHGAESTHSLDRFGRGRIVEWLQRGWSEGDLSLEHRK